MTKIKVGQNLFEQSLHGPSDIEAIANAMTSIDNVKSIEFTIFRSYEWRAKAEIENDSGFGLSMGEPRILMATPLDALLELIRENKSEFESIGVSIIDDDDEVMA